MTGSYPIQTAHATEGGRILFALAVTAPHCAIQPLPNDNKVIHAATMESVLHHNEDGTMTAACGTAGLKILSVEMKGESALPWPPRVNGLAPMTRCRDCWHQTGQ